ncbi:Metallo-beta-lactamase superfamily protein [Microbulbifer donghaiensis]|uniref:Metallo-beta-lactamase superfamily protein n=1 Tax=Microbulbifer donghaiensis TaxID=494016 RepID=A0A1M4VQ61_9GAMM|nr:MBL fold metallo-hydrolase [Microbulbifer donghaiensis]SHE71194.1 Metallo-beta-lactamase superfamily protein [Microbulbifer donghaiensis]
MYSIKKFSLYLPLATLLLSAPFIHAGELQALREKNWNHGSEDCEINRDPPIEIYQHDPDTFILRQNRCLNHEAPFIYALFGEEILFLQDTGATADAEQFPLYETVRSLIERRKAAGRGEPQELLVTHSHGHRDHKAADGQFLDKPGVTLVAAELGAVREYFALSDWPNGSSQLDLGGRELTILPTPGHHAQSIAVYDSHTEWLLTGDTFYPGRLYIDDWDAYRASIERLLNFCQDNPVAALLGTHIEMSSTPGRDYSRGSSFQPDEAPLPLAVADLQLLHNELQALGTEPKRKVLDNFIIQPKTRFERFLGWGLKKLGL